MKKLYIILWGQCENYRRDSDNKRSYPKGQLAFSVFVLTHIAMCTYTIQIQIQILRTI